MIIYRLFTIELYPIKTSRKVAHPPPWLAAYRFPLRELKRSPIIGSFPQGSYPKSPSISEAATRVVASDWPVPA